MSITFPQLNLTRVVFEVRFDNGYLYWDKCGEETREILKLLGKEWSFVDISAKDGNVLINKRLQAEIRFSISTIKIFQNDVENLSKFKEICSQTIPIIQNYQKVEDFKRVGNRYWYIYPVNSLDLAKQIVLKTGIIKLNNDILNAFGTELKDTEFVLAIEDSNKNLQYRIKIVAVERDDERLPAYSEYFTEIERFKKYNPKYAVMLDIDIATKQETKTKNLDSADFIQKAYKKLENNLVSLLKPEQQREV